MGNVTAWFRTGVVRVTGRLACEPKTEFQVRIPQEWQWLAVVGRFFGGSFVPSCSARRRPGAGAFLGQAELRSRERKPLISRALCRLIPSVTSQLPALDRRCRVVPFDRGNHASKAQSQRRRGVQSSLSRRKVDLPTAFRSDHLASTGERSAAGRVRGGPPRAQQKLGGADRAQRCGQG